MIGQQAVERETTSLSSAQMRALRWRHDNQQGQTVTACSARREKSTCDSNRGISADEIEARVLNGLRDILLGNESLIDGKNWRMRLYNL